MRKLKKHPEEMFRAGEHGVYARRLTWISESDELLS
jgi:hypothetical protein